MLQPSDCEDQRSQPQHVDKGREATCKALVYVIGCDTLDEQEEGISLIDLSNRPDTGLIIKCSFIYFR